jgi:hypothetical protein
MAAVVGQIGMWLGIALMLALDLFMVILLAPTPYLIVDQDKGVMEAFSDSAAAMKGKVLVTLALMLVVTLACAAVNAITFSLGNLLTLPFLMLFWAVVYAKATGQKTAY